MKPVAVLFGTPEMIRTSDARFRKPTLYPLSYGGSFVSALADEYDNHYNLSILEYQV